MTDRTRENPQADAEQTSEGTKARCRILEAAGHVFAEVGYDRALSRDIAARAGVSPAAINYYFGGKDGLYEAVFREADRRLFAPEQIQTILSDSRTPEDALRAFIHLIVSTLLAPEVNTWCLQLVAREMTAPTPILDEYIRNDMRPQSEAIRRVVAAITGLPIGHLTVSSCVASILAQCVFLYQNRLCIPRVFPEMIKLIQEPKAFAEHIFRFSMAGIRAAPAQGRAQGAPA